MTEEQRMEEGRRMFQIFAARMFEQRVLTAYREKVAQERQKKLLEELEEETRQDVEREQKRAKEAQKKKDKKRLQKLAKDEERARKEAEKAAEEAAQRAIEEKKAEEQRLKREEQRKKKEAERKAQEEERLRKEAEKQKRLQEEREKQAEQERKHREAKEREKKKKEEARKKEREEREAKERELKEKKEREDRERIEKQAKAKADAEARERARKEELAAQQAALAASAAPVLPMPAPSLKRSAPIPSLPVPSGLPAQPQLRNVKSPHLQIATPAVPKTTVPVRACQASQQGSEASSPNTPLTLAKKGQSASPSTTSQQSSPGPVGAPRKPSLPHGQYHPPPPTNIPATMAPPPGVPLPSPSAFSAMPPTSNTHDIPTSLSSLFPNLTPRVPAMHEAVNYTNHQPPVPAQYRGFAPVGLMPGAAAPNPLRQAPVGRGLGMDGVPGMGHYGGQIPYGAQPAPTYSKPRDTMPTHSHSRHHSVETPNLESLELPPATGPISKPAPIQRPSSGSKQRVDGRRTSLQAEIDDLSNHLGSSALIDGNDEPFNPDMMLGRRASAAPIQAGPRQGRSRFPYTSMYPPAASRMSPAHPLLESIAKYIIPQKPKQMVLDSKARVWPRTTGPVLHPLLFRPPIRETRHGLSIQVSNFSLPLKIHLTTSQTKKGPKWTFPF